MPLLRDIEGFYYFFKTCKKQDRMSTILLLFHYPVIFVKFIKYKLTMFCTSYNITILLCVSTKSCSSM